MSSGRRRTDEDARLYLENGEDMGIAMSTDEWVAWMVEITREAVRVCTGLVAWVVEGRTNDYRYSCSPFLLMSDLCRAGFNLRKPCVYERDGIPGSGGPDWLKNRWEPIVCVTRPGRLPWSNNKACGHEPVYGVGGALSYRTLDGTRVNKRRKIKGAGGGGRAANGQPKHNEEWARGGFTQPDLANPGNVIRCDSGGGRIGSELAHENEAPYPEKIPELFVASFCPPGGITLDPFAGSGTTGAVAVRLARRFIGVDLRQSQVDLSRKRIEGETPDMFETLEARRTP